MCRGLLQHAFYPLFLWIKNLITLSLYFEIPYSQEESLQNFNGVHVRSCSGQRVFLNLANRTKNNGIHYPSRWGLQQQAQRRTSVTCTRADSSSLSEWSCLSLGYSYSYSIQAWLTHRSSPIPVLLQLMYLLKILTKHANLKWSYLEIWNVHHMPLLGKYWWSSG